MRLLFITANRLGDAVLSTGLLGHLIEGGGVATTVACGPAAAELFACLPGLERVIRLEKRPWGGHWWRLWRRVAARRWDRIVDLRASPVSFLLSSRHRRTLRKAGQGHRVESLAAWYGCHPAPAPRVWSGAAHAEEARRLLPQGAPVLGLAPTAGWRGKLWPAHRFAALARRLTGRGGPLCGARIAVFGGPGEQALAAPVLAALPQCRTIDLVGRAHLLTVAEMLRRCRLVVANDSGLMHLAAAAGAPTLGLFGPSRPEHYAPWGAKSAHIATAIAYGDLFGPGYDRRTTGTLMESLTVDAAEGAARALLERA